jgi:xylulokinase
MKYIMGIDICTSATKTVMFDLSFNVVAFAAGEYPLYQPQNCWAEQDPNDL